MHMSIQQKRLDPDLNHKPLSPRISDPVKRIPVPPFSPIHYQWAHRFLVYEHSDQAYVDLLRLHFFFAWPVLFCSGFLLAATVYGTHTTLDLVRAALIGFFGFEAGFVLNDYVDCEYDRRDIEADRLTRYWRIFGTRPLPAGLIPPRNALVLFGILSASAALLIISLPFPNSIFVLAIMAANTGWRSSG